MQRTPEPELMTEYAQVSAYAQGNFEQPHERFMHLLRERLPGLGAAGTALDIGCGPGDIACRFARAFPGWRVHGIDGSGPMLELARQRAAAARLDARVSFHLCYLPLCSTPCPRYDLLFSNSLLHHLADPLALWQAIRGWCHAGSAVFVMDLLRPASVAEARQLVEAYSRDEPEILRRDFFHSLLAAYRLEEVREQLHRAELDAFRVEIVSDRHWLVASN